MNVAWRKDVEDVVGLMRQVVDRETVKRGGWGLISIEGYAGGNNRQLAERRSSDEAGVR